jgi:hypothetical protein
MPRLGKATDALMTMLMRPCQGRLPISRAVVFGCALIIAAPVIGSVARADDTQPAVLAAEVGRARAEMDGTLARMTTASRRVRLMLLEARRLGTRPQVTCLDEALSRADTARRSARIQMNQALAAYARGDVVAARDSRAKVAELDGTQRLAVRDGGACTPKPVIDKVVLGTTVRLVVDPSIPPERPSDTTP